MRVLIAALLVAFWPLATLHTALEAAGVEISPLVHDDHGHSDDDAHSGESHPVDLHPSDDLSLQGAGPGVKVRCPELWSVSDQLVLRICSYVKETVVPPPRGEESIWLLKTWRFEQRAAWPSRAPGHFA